MDNEERSREAFAGASVLARP